MGTKFVDFNNPQNQLSQDCELILMDTCSIIKLVSGEQNAVDFAKFALNNDIMLCYSVKSLEELNIISQSKNFPKGVKKININNEVAINQSLVDADNAISILTKLPNVYPEPIGMIDSKAIEEIKNNSIKHKLRWGDATIYTQAKQNEIKYIWTYDQDWVNVDDDDMCILIESRFIPNVIVSNDIT